MFRICTSFCKCARSRLTPGGVVQSEGVIACAKHYILNEQEHFRNNMDVRIDDRTMHEVYLW